MPTRPDEIAFVIISKVELSFVGIEERLADSPWQMNVRRRNQNRIVLARNLDLLESGEHQRLDPKVTEIKKMLTSSIKKLRADR